MKNGTSKKWIQIMGLAMGLPSTILAVAWGAMQLVKIGVLTKVQGVVILIVIVGSILFLMVYYAYKRKD